MKIDPETPTECSMPRAKKREEKELKANNVLVVSIRISPPLTSFFSRRHFPKRRDIKSNLLIGPLFSRFLLSLHPRERDSSRKIKQALAQKRANNLRDGNLPFRAGIKRGHLPFLRFDKDDVKRGHNSMIKQLSGQGLSHLNKSLFA